LAGADDARPALNGGFGFRNFLALNGIDPKSKETGKRLASGTNADISLHKGGITREVKNGVAGKMVRLELVKIKETPEEIGGGEAEAALEVSEKNDVFTGPRHRFDLVARKPAGYSLRNPSGPVKPVNLVLANVRAHPGSACDTGKIYAGSLARAAGLLVVTGVDVHLDKIGG
jgi:RNA-binding protein YhbY